ncbi:MAG: AAA family ATPase, partial [Oscillospiraceae bacterium]|nr:AAA family ATPase [Oscillospiraceae bacterium]
MWEKICIIDTENESGSLYVGKQVGSTRVGEYLTINLEAPFSAARYLEAIDLAEQAGVEYLVIDSLSHAWTGEGGLLDVQGNVAKRSGNSYTAWREVTPMHNRLVDRILQCAMHVALTLRTKTEYVIEDNGNGKKTPRKIGMA